MTAEDLIERYEQRIARLEGLIEISRSLNSMLNLRPLLYCIVSAARELTGTEASSILLVDRKSGQLYFEAATNLQGIRSIIVPMEGSVAGWVVKTGEPLIVTDARSDPRFYRHADEQSEFVTNSILAAPLVARGKVIGVLEALNKRRGDPEEEDIELLTVLADQAAVAVQNAIFFQQSDLIAEIVHEMRTPLGAVMAYAELLQRPDVSPDQCRQFAGVILHETERLNEMADSFLDYARLESGRAHLSQDPVDVDTVIRMAVNVVLPQADAKQLGMAIDVPSDLPTVVGDAQRLHQALLNLLTNAVKYTEVGDNVTVTAEQEGDRLIVSVIDTGPGIPAKALPRIFERFYRVPTTEDEVMGTGLGLAITQRIIEGHGGEISIDSVEGQGTTVTFSLPVPTWD